MNRNIQSLTAAAVACVLTMAAAPTHAATVLHEYGLGEAGTLDGSGHAVDSAGTADFANGTTDLVATAHSGSPVPGSTHYGVSDGVGTGQFQTPTDNWDSLESIDNFFIEIFARASGSPGGFPTIFEAQSGATGTLQLVRDADEWILFYRGVGQIGKTAIDSGEWTHLAAVVETTAGTATTTLYVDGVSVGSADRSRVLIPTGQATFLAGSGGVNDFVGDVDEMRVVSFDPDTENPVDLFAINVNVIPTPAALPAGLGLLALTFLRRKRGV